MKKLAFALSAAAALFVTAGTASAQVYYPGPGVGVYVGPGEPYYERRYRRHHEYYAQDYGPRERYYRPRRGKCPPHYTVQDGICKPYRGY